MEQADNEKQFLSDTLLTFLAKNTNSRESGITVGQDVQICIPRTEHVIRLNKAYFDVEVQIPMNVTTDDDTRNPFYVGVLNAATLFDRTYINNGGADMEPNEFAQPQARMWQMFRSPEYLEANPSSFINYRDVTKNEHFILYPLKEIGTAGANYTFSMRIPLPSLFPMFENCDNFSTTQLNDDITLSMTLSDLDKYIVIVKTDEGKIVNIKPLPSTKTFEFAAGNTLTLSDDDNYKINKFRMVVPGHYPTDVERANFANLVGTGSVKYPFKDFDVVIRGARYTGGDEHLSFPTNCANIYAILMAATHANSYVVYDKPYMCNMECNLAELHQLANGGVHTGYTYTGDMDMLRNLTNLAGTDAFKNLNRFDFSILHDYLQKDESSDTIWGSYVQAYRVAAGNQLGFSADYFANLINFHYRIDAGIAEGAAHPNNFAQGHMLCCQLRQRFLVYKDGGIDIVCPFSEELDMRAISAGDPKSQTHGLPAIVPALLSPATGLVKSAVKGLRGLVEKHRAQRNNVYAYQRLGKEGYEKHREIIDGNNTMRRKHFKEFINNLSEAEKQLHGLFIKHGDEDANAEGPGSATIHSSLDDIRGSIRDEKPVDQNLLNLTSLYRPSLNSQFADKSWKMKLVLDYKHGLNKHKLKLTMFGSEGAMINASHGLKDWLKRGWSKIKNFFKTNGKDILRGLGQNALNIVKQYASDLIAGKISIKEVPGKFKNAVLQLVKDGKLTGNEDLDSKLSEVYNYAEKIKNGTMDWSQVPAQIINKVREEVAKNKDDTAQGLFIRHGFNNSTKLMPSVNFSISKRRINKILEKDPRLRTQKDLRKVALLNYYRNRPMNEDTHGKAMASYRRLIGIKDPKPTPLVHAHPVIRPVIHAPKPAVDKYKEKLAAIKNKLLGSDDGKKLLVAMKSSDNYHGKNSKKKYRLLKYASLKI